VVLFTRVTPSQAAALEREVQQVRESRPGPVSRADVVRELLAEALSVREATRGV